MSKLKRNIYYDCIGNANKIKALSMQLFCMHQLGSHGIKHYTANKLHKLTGLHINTCKKYMRTLKDMGLVVIEGKSNTLFFRSVRGKHDRRNIVLDGKIDYTSVKSVEYSLNALLIVEIQNQKRYVKQAIESATNGRTPSEVKQARRTCRFRRYGRVFSDDGLSYKTIAKKLGVGIQKAFFTVMFGESLGLFHKVKNVVQVYCKNAAAFFAFADHDYTFCTEHNLYKVGANRYELPDSWSGMVYN